MIYDPYMNSKDVTARSLAAQKTTYDGYDLYAYGRPLHHCGSIADARLWLLAQWEHDCSMAAEWGVKPTETHPGRLTDTDVQGIIQQSDEQAEIEFWEDRRRGN